MPNLEDVLPEVFVRETGTDGVPYAVVPLLWTLPAVARYYEKFQKFKSDYVPESVDAFERFVLNSSALWFEVINETTGEPVGIVYLTDFVFDPDTGRYISASYHVSMWDAKFSVRLPLQLAFVRAIFKRFGLHRLETEIPLYAGGAIRMAKKAGFVEKSVRHKARRYNGVWYDVLHLAILENEVP